MDINGGSMGRRSPKTMLLLELTLGAPWLLVVQQKR
ncbi:hypothetical protein A2U01_0108246, partial [Trifolium medium]|nr:hypothetical protein [Trifolium medium]